MRDNGKDAIAYAGQGWRVVPLHTAEGGVCDCRRPDCPAPAKHPRVRGWTQQASADAGTVAEWWRRWPAANVGLLTGAATGLVVLDVDPRHGGDSTLEGWTQAHGLLPFGPAVATGGGGWHYYFRHPGGRISSRTIAPGVDAKGDGGQVVAPPSVHATGVSYTWCEDAGPEVRLPEVPDWLLVLMRSEATDAGHADRELPRVITQGERNTRLASIAGTMRRRGLSEATIFGALLAENAERCVPPLERTEVAAIAASAARYEEVPEGQIEFTRRVVQAVPPEARLARPVSLRALQREEFPPLKMAVPGLLPEGLALLCGRLKLGKSWLMLGIGIAIAEGGIALGELPVEDGDVLYVAYEDSPRRLQSRVRTLLGEAAWPERMEVAASGCWPRRDEGGLAAVDAWLGQHPRARLVVIDTLQRFRGGGGGESRMSAYAADYVVSGELQELALRHEVVIVAVHHYRKALSDVDWVDQVSGTNGTAGAADTILGFERERGSKDAVLKVAARDVDEAEMALAFDAARYGWYIAGTAEELRLTNDQRAFTAALWETGRGQPVHVRALAEAMDKRRNTVVQMGRRLADAGAVVSLGGGMYAPRMTDGGRGNSVIGVIGVNNVSGTNLKDGRMPMTNGLSSGCHSVIGKGAEGEPMTPMTTDDNAIVIGIRTGIQVPARQVIEADDNDDTKTVFWDKAEPPPDGCPACGGTAWSRRVDGRWHCDGCEPWLRLVDQSGQE